MSDVDVALRRVDDGWNMARRDAPQEDAVVLAAEVRRLRGLVPAAKCRAECDHLLEAAMLSTQVLESEIRRDQAMSHLRKVTGADAERLAQDMDHDNRDHAKWWLAVKRARRWLERKLQPAVSDPPCIIGVRCERHDFVHGAEAEELRNALEEHVHDESCPPWVQKVLDRVDARDSSAWIEFERALEAGKKPVPRYR